MTVSPPPILEAGSDFVPAKAARQAEARAYAGMRKVLGQSVPQPAPSPAAPVILVPGFVSGDVSLVVLARTLRRAGHRTYRSHIGANLGCTDDMVDRLLERVEEVAGLENRPVVLVGHSRGGMVVKLAARRRPDLIDSIVTMSAPLTGTLRVAAHVRKQLEWLFALNRRGFGWAMSEDCVVGECAARIAAELDGPFPAEVGFVSIYTRNDAIIDWRTCLDPAAELVEVDGSHSGMGFDAEVARIVIERLQTSVAAAR